MKINEVILFSKNLKAQKQFYQSTLGVELVEESSTKITFRFGESFLSFIVSKVSKVAHLAFNIPSNKINEAFSWLSDKTTVLDYKGEQITTFSNWNAEAIYFYDTDGNIMEFIARHNLNIEDDLSFSATSILNISEVGIPVDDIELVYTTLKVINPLPIYDGDFNRFCAVGNEEGLFILVDRNKKQWYPTMQKIELTDVIVKGDYNFEYKNGIIKELS